MIASRRVDRVQFVARGKKDNALVNQGRQGAFDVEGPHGGARCAIDRDEVLALERNVGASLVHCRARGRGKLQRDQPRLFGGKHGRNGRLDLLRSLTAEDDQTSVTDANHRHRQR